MAKKAITTPAAKTPMTPLKHAEGMVYGAGLQVKFEQEAYDKGLKALVEEIHRLAKNVDEIAVDESRSPHEKIEYINHAVIETLPNLHLTEMFRRGHSFETAQDDLKHEQKVLAILKGKEE